MTSDFRCGGVGSSRIVLVTVNIRHTPEVRQYEIVVRPCILNYGFDVFSKSLSVVYHVTKLTAIEATCPLLGQGCSHLLWRCYPYQWRD